MVLLTRATTYQARGNATFMNSKSIGLIAPPNSPSNSLQGSPRAVREANNAVPCVEPAPCEQPNTAPHALAALLNRGDKANFSAALTALRTAGTTTLDLHGEMLSTKGMQCLADVLKEHHLSPNGLHITHIDLSDTQCGEIDPLMNTLAACKGVTGLDCSGAQSLDAYDPVDDTVGLRERALRSLATYAYDLPVHGAAGLSERALRSIAAFMDGNTTLRKLSLNRQPGLKYLAFLPRWEIYMHLNIRKKPPLAELMASIARSSLEELALRDCGLTHQDWNSLRPGLDSHEAKLKCLDLKGNDRMASVGDKLSCSSMLGCIDSLNQNRHLKQLILPEAALNWFQSGMLEVKDASFKASLALPKNSTIELISPLTDSAIDDPTLNAMRTQIRFRRELLPLIWCVRENRYGGGVPHEIEKLIVKTAFQEPPRQ